MKKITKRIATHYAAALAVALIGAGLASTFNKTWIFVVSGFAAVAVGAPGVFLFLQNIDDFLTRRSSTSDDENG